jgi:hypothetical protein
MREPLYTVVIGKFRFAKKIGIKQRSLRKTAIIILKEWRLD